MFSNKPSPLVYSILNLNKPIEEKRIKQIATILSYSSEVHDNFFPQSYYDSVRELRGKIGKATLYNKIEDDLEEGVVKKYLKIVEENPIQN